MITAAWARDFANDWIAAWNSHDLERIFAHYRDDFEMRSPFIIDRMGVPSGTLRGKAAVRPYWQLGLETQPQLHFELHDVLVGVDPIAIYYHSATRKRMVAEFLCFDDQRRVMTSAGLYGDVLA